MTSKERVKMAVTFQGPDRVPVNHWYLPAAIERHGDNLRKVFAEYPSDIVQFFSCLEKEEIDRAYTLGLSRDWWGTVWECNFSGVWGRVKEYPLGDWAAFKSYKPPVQILKEGWEELPRQIEASQEKFVTGAFIRFFERMHFLRPFEDILLDLMDGRPEVYRLRDMILEFNLAHIEKYLQYDFDLLWFSDDWGTQTSLLISPKLWREFFKHGYKAMVDLVHSKGKLALLHSDGHIVEIIDDLMEVGFDAINMQVHCMDMEELSRKYRGKLCFWGCMDRQYFLPSGKPEEVYQETGRMIRLFNTPQGGFIGQGEIGADVPLENARAMLKGWYDFGQIKL